MSDTTIVTNSPVGRHLDSLGEGKPASYLMFNHKKVELVAKITIGRDTDNDVVVDNKLASRHHAMIQKIKDAYFIKDVGSTNGTFINEERIDVNHPVEALFGDMISFAGVQYECR